MSDQPDQPPEPGYSNLTHLEGELLHGASLYAPDFVALPVQLVIDAERGIALVPAGVGSPAAVVMACTLAIPAAAIRHATVVNVGMGPRPLAGLAAVTGRVLLRRDDLTEEGLASLQQLDAEHGQRVESQYRLEWGDADTALWVGPDGRRLAALRMGGRWRAFDPSAELELDLGILAEGGSQTHVNGFLRAWQLQ